MREIKFRAYDEEAGKMIYTPNETPHDATNETDCYYIGWTSITGTWQMYCESNGRIREIDNLMQNTGVNDINRKAIYEGDILTDAVGECCTVIFRDGSFGCSKTHNWDYLTHYAVARYKYRVDGNVYETAGRLKGKEL